MSTEGIQITIPDFDEDEYVSTPNPFGRSAGHGFGFGGGFGGGSGSGMDSPTLVTPIAADRGERSYFSHSRGDSVASEDSGHSATTRYTVKSSTPFTHSSQSSIAAPSATGFTKKSSFASIRNAFKSGKNSEAPPVPQLDHQAYPALKNPFNRSTTSLNQVTPTTARGPIGGPLGITASPTFHRPPTPGSADPRRGTPSSRSKVHSYAKSQHSQSGSIFHTSDGGSDYGHGHSSSPPPVPRVPLAFGHVQRSETPEFEDDKVVMDPKTPSDYALHAVFIRFATSAEGKIDAFLRQTLDRDSLLPEFIGPGVDSKFDDTLQSLAKIAQKHTKPVVDSIMRWRRSQSENVGSDIIRLHMAQSPSSTRAIRPHDIPGLLNERKSLAAIYVMCRALIAVLQTISKDALGETTGYVLEELTFEQFRKPDLKLLSQSANHRTNAELYASLLGHISNVRFVSVTDRFLMELGPLSHGQVSKDLEMKYENLVKGIKHIQIKVWPPEAFEDGADFMERLSMFFTQAHGFRLKTSFADTLVQILHPIGKTAQAETNHPQWAKAIELIYPKAREMMSKPRYWSVAFPLAITSLCVAPQGYFLKHWMPCFEAALAKLKEKPYRVAIMNGMVRLLWTYLYRCQEPASTTTSKLDNVLKCFFPANRLTIFPPIEDHVEPFIYIVHFVLSRHFEYGRDFCLELIQESAPGATQQSGIAGGFAPERLAIAIQAILLSLHGLEREAPTPTWPSSSDYAIIPSLDDYPSSSAFLPPSFLTKPGMQEFFDRCGTTLGAIAVSCGNMVGQMSAYDEQWSYARLNPSYEESHNFVVRRHPEGGTVAYPNHLVAQISMLQTCFQSWPRCLHPSVPLGDAIDMLVRGVVHVEPLVGEVATAALKRFTADPTHALTVITRFTTFLFSPLHLTQEGPGIKLLIDSPQLLSLWVSVVESWVHDLVQRPLESLAEDEKMIMPRCIEIEAGAMFLLAHENWAIHSTGVKVIRILGLLVARISGEPSSPGDVPDTSLRFVQLLHGRGLDRAYLSGYDELLDKAELARLEQWRESKRIDLPLRVADSTNDKDRKLWRYLFPAFMQTCMEHPTSSLTLFRDSVVAAVTRYHSTMSHLAGLSTSSRVPLGLPNRTPVISERDGPRLVRENKTLIDQWHIWVKVLCSTATVQESRTLVGREHSRAPSDANFERERYLTNRGLFRYLTPFLDSEYTLFRDAAVLCISSLPYTAYQTLLEDLSSLAGRQFYDEPRIKPGATIVVEQHLNLFAARQLHEEFRNKAGIVNSVDRTRRQERLHSAVARIYYLTAHFLQQRSSGRPANLAYVLKFVRNTQAFLTSSEMRENYTLQRLRRYFCGTVERLFDALANLNDSDRFTPPHMHLALYRLCDEWCRFGPQSEAARQRLIMMQRAAASSNGQADVNGAVERFQNETLMLSYAAVGALASLCEKAFFPSDISSTSPVERLSPEFLKPLGALAFLERFGAILASAHAPTQLRGKKALKLLLTHSPCDDSLLEESLKRAIVMDQADTGNGRFFEVISDIVCHVDNHGFTFAQIVCLGLSNLCHSSLATRRHAFNMLEAIHHQSAGLLAMSQFDATVGSLASSTYVHAHSQISDFFAGEHPDQAANVVAQIASWLAQLPETLSGNVTLLLLQSLEFWVPNIDLLTDDRAGFSRQGLSTLYHLMSLTLRFGQTHTEQILVLWMRLLDPPHQSNGHATVRFLVEQSHKVGSPVFIDCAANIVACLCQTAIGRQVFDELCGIIEPLRMLPTIEHKLAFPEAEDMELWSDLDALFAQPKLLLGSAQFAWLFLADVALQRYWELKSQLPVLLHMLFTHLDYKIPFVRQRAQRMLFQLLRSWAPGYDELSDRSTHNRAALKAAIDNLEEQANSMYWKEDESPMDAEPKMKWLCSEVLNLLAPLCPKLAETWGGLALFWGTTVSIRSVAFRSLQVFRAVLPPIGKVTLSQLLARLSNTIAAADTSLRSFTSEILQTLQAVVASDQVEKSFLPKMFWCACACLSTTVEQEFAQAVQLLGTLLLKVDLDDPSAIELLIAECPQGWTGSSSLQSALLAGLRSSITSDATMKILQTLTKIEDSRLIDPTEGRVRDLYTLSLPWCLHAMAPDTPHDQALRDFAQNIGVLAELEGRQSIHKIMMSFAKGHFRTKEDFLRQSVASLREHYGVDHWTEIVTLLLGLVLNRQRWLRVHAMQILKVLFQQRETRSPVELLGSELLMPLLRLLETDVASQALDVLEEPMTMSGGLAAKHVLRMSMHARTLTKDVNSVATVFGIPEASGWCVVKADTLRATCCANLLAVYDTCQISTRPSRIDFEPEVEALAEPAPLEDDLGGLVQNLHELTTFFQDDEPSEVHAPMPMPNRQLEARVAAILAKSTASEAVPDVPQTPFRDVFRVGGLDASDDSEDYSDSDSDLDVFIFDSPSVYRSAPNGSGFHT